MLSLFGRKKDGFKPVPSEIPNAQKIDKDQCLADASKGEFALVFKFLKEKIILPTIVHGPYKSTLLHYAAQHGTPGVIQKLIIYDVPINELDNYRHTPLHLAVIAGHIKNVQVLVDNKAKINTQDSTGNTPLHRAVSNCNLEMAELLISAGADTNITNQDRETPLEALRGKNLQVGKAAMIVRAFLAAGANLDCLKHKKGVISYVVLNEIEKLESLKLHQALSMQVDELKAKVDALEKLQAEKTPSVTPGGS